MRFPHPALLCALLLSPPVTPAAEPALRPWEEYRAVMWIGPTAGQRPEKLPLFIQRLREMGINTGMVSGDADARPWVEAGMPFYVENIVNKGLCLKWNSRVSDWEKMVTAWKTPRDEEGLLREYSFDDPLWLEGARDAMTNAVRKHAANHPSAYDIRDELSTTLSANPFDYDFSPSALAGFRAWLKTQYPNLTALNAEWETAFASWDEVKPFTTDQIKNRLASGEGTPHGQPDWQALQAIKFVPSEARKNPTRWNFSSWCDHRTYMDFSLARTLGDLRETARKLDPHTPVGIEGTQMPSAFGGYDLWRLSRVLDWVEPYDIGNAREIWGSFMPGKPILTTVGEQDANAARRRLWHLLLEGDKGCIVWWSEDCLNWKSEDYALTPRAKALAPLLAEMQSPLASLFMKAGRECDAMALHYSQPSIQVDWLLESSEDGSTWLRRFSSYEAQHNQMAQRRQGWLKLLEDAGYSPQFISTEQIERGELEKLSLLVMADSAALTNQEEARVETFLSHPSNSRLLLGSGPCGAFDGRGKLRPPEPVQGRKVIESLWSATDTWWRNAGGSPDAGSTHQDISHYLSQRGTARALETHQVFLARLHRAQAPPLEVPPEACVRTHRYRLGSARLVAFERNIVWQMSEDLRQAGGNEALEKPVQFTAQLPALTHVYELRSGSYLGYLKSIPVSLDPWQPSLFALTDDRLPEGDCVTELARLLPH